jgi:hypothetical protein
MGATVKRDVSSWRLFASVALLIVFWLGARRLPNFESSRFTPWRLAIVCFSSFAPLAMLPAVLKAGSWKQKVLAVLLIFACGLLRVHCPDGVAQANTQPRWRGDLRSWNSSIVLVEAIAGDRLFVASGTGFEAAAENVRCVARGATVARRVIVVVGTQAEDNAEVFFAVNDECRLRRRFEGLDPNLLDA